MWHHQRASRRCIQGIVLTGDSAMGRREVVMLQCLVQAAYSGEPWFLIAFPRILPVARGPPRAQLPRKPSRNRPRCNTMTAKLSVHAHVGILHQCSERKITPDSPTVCTSAVGCRHVRECTRVQGGQGRVRRAVREYAGVPRGPSWVCEHMRACVCTSCHEAPLAVAAGARPGAPSGRDNALED